MRVSQVLFAVILTMIVATGFAAPPPVQAHEIGKIGVAAEMAVSVVAASFDTIQIGVIGAIGPPAILAAAESKLANFRYAIVNVVSAPRHDAERENMDNNKETMATIGSLKGAGAPFV